MRVLRRAVGSRFCLGVGLACLGLAVGLAQLGFAWLGLASFGLAWINSLVLALRVTCATLRVPFLFL